MAKKTKPAPAEKTERVSKFTPDEERSYVEAIIRKQCGLTDAAAIKAKADDLSPEEFVLLHDAGREGQLDVVREILGLE
jgi:hypothetical protein